MNRRKILSLLLTFAMLFSLSACTHTVDMRQIGEQLTNVAEGIMDTASAIEQIAEAEPEYTEDISDESNAAVEALEQDYSGGKPWIDSDIKSNVTADMETSPKDDFHLYINRDWIASTDFMEGMTTHGPFMDLHYEIMNNAKSILTDTSLEGEDVLLVQSLYNAVLDWDARNAVGVEPIKSIIDKINSIQNTEQMSDFLCNIDESLLVDIPIAIENTVDLNDSSSYIMTVNNAGLMLGDAAEYTERTALGDRYYNAYKKLATAMLQKLDYSETEAAKMLDDVISYEEMFAKVSFTSAEQMDPSYLSKINNIMTL